MKLTVLLYSLLSFTAMAGPMQTLSSHAEFESYLQERQFNGVLFVQKGAKTLYKKAWGYRDIRTQVPLALNDKLQMGSITKQFVSAAVLKLQEQGKLNIDQAVVRYLPEFSFLAPVRIRDLMNMSSGVASYTDNERFWRFMITPETSKSIIRFTSRFPLKFTPKSEWSYSNSNYIILGHLIEKISGKAWDQFIKEQFLIPLGMRNTGYVELFKTVSPVVGHIPNDQGSFEPVDDFNLSWALAAGALYTTVEDLAKWTDIYGSSNLLSDNSKKEMQTPYLANYALGVIVTDYDGETQIFHNGRTPGYTAGLTYLKESQLKVVRLDNNDGGFADVSSIALSFFKRGKAEALKLKVYPVDPNKLVDYVGTYTRENHSMVFDIYVREGVLFLKPAGQPPYSLLANDIDSFRLLNLAGEEFIRDQTGEVTGLKHYQNGHVSVFKKER